MTMTAAGVAKLIEECGELQQVTGKLVQTLGKRLAMWDQDEHWDGSNLRDRMAEEMGDVRAAIDFVAGRFDLMEEVVQRYMVKAELFDKWESMIENNDHGIDASPKHPSEPWLVQA